MKPGRILDVTIPEALPSWNLWWSGMTPDDRRVERDKWRVLVAKALAEQTHAWRPAGPEDYPLTLIVHVGKRRGVLDCSNVCVKVVEDPLIGRVIHDDRPAYIGRVVVTAGQSDEGDFTHVVLTVGA